MLANSRDDESEIQNRDKEGDVGEECRTWAFGPDFFKVPSQYHVRDLIGKGAYGLVCSAYDQKSEMKVAIKKIVNVFENRTCAMRSLREILLLRSFKHENIISLKTIIPPSDSEFSDLYIVTDLMETDLSTIIRSPQKLSDEHCQFFIYQILRGLKYIHSANVVHRDLKPRNVLVNSNCDLKICDLGLARFLNPNVKLRSNITGYVATRWYRAPEVLLNWKSYGKPVDIWAVGCILGELLRRKPLFPGKDCQHQLSLIVNLTGKCEIDCSELPEKSKEIYEQLPNMVKADFNELFAECNPLAIDLLDKLLRFDPKERYTVEEALHHPYFSLLHVDEDEPVCSEIDTADWEFDLQIENNYSKEDIRIQYSDKFQGSVIPGHYRSHSF